MVTSRRLQRATHSTHANINSVPNGMKLLTTLVGHRQEIGRMCWSPDGQKLATPSMDKSIRIWNTKTGKTIRSFKTNGGVYSVAWSKDGSYLAAVGRLGTKIWNVLTGNMMGGIELQSDFSMIAWSPTDNLLATTDGQTLKVLDSKKFLLKAEVSLGGHNIFCPVCWSPNGKNIAVKTIEGIVLFDSTQLKVIEVLKSQESVYGIAWKTDGFEEVIAAGVDRTISIFERHSGRKLLLEGHTSNIEAVAFSSDGRLLASRANTPDYSIRLWRCDTWETIAMVPQTPSGEWPGGIAFHPKLPILATLDDNDLVVRLWQLDLNVLLGDKRSASSRIIQHTTAKVVLVGDSGVGKTGLGWRLAHGEFKEHSSTHGQQFWVLNDLTTRRQDGTECEAIIWDLAGQPDYRLIHALFVDDADLVLIIFDPTDSRDPLHGVEFWLRQLRGEGNGRSVLPNSNFKGVCPTILIAGRTDRGEARITHAEIDAFCKQRGISGGYVATSAKEGKGLDDLVRRMKEAILWDQKTATVTTITFKRIKDYVLSLKENRRRRKIILNPQELRARLVKEYKAWSFTDDEMMTAVGHLANYGYVRILRTSNGEERILLSPELLNNLAASFVLEARRNPKGLGSLEIKRLLAGEYRFRELEKLSKEEAEILLDSATLLFLKHNVCFRETDPLSEKSYLVFPELINLKKPNLINEELTEDTVAYTVNGAIENLYASLVVLLGYTQTFTRTDQWRSQARYEVGNGLICGFRQNLDAEELELVLYFGANVGRPVRTLFQGLFESFLARRNLNVFRYESVSCSKGHMINRSVIREELRGGSDFVFCSKCGERVSLPSAREAIQLTETEQRKVQKQQWFATERSRFEQAVFQLAIYAEAQKLNRPQCFISYAWGDRKNELWVERNLATDLKKAGIGVLLDKWENARIGASIMRFIEKIDECDKIIVVGTPAYRAKYSNKGEQGFVVAAEGDLMVPRLLGTNDEKESILPLILAGSVKEALPAWLRGRVYADFRNDRAYFTTCFDLILSLYGISPETSAVADLRESLMELPSLN